MQDALRIRAQAPQNPNRTFGFPCHREAAAGIEIALGQRFFDLLEGDVILQERRRIDEDLILLAVAFLDKHLRHSWDLEQSWPHDPIRGGAQRHELRFFRRKDQLDRFAVNCR